MTTDAVPTAPVYACGETTRTAAPQVPRFLRSQGVSTFTVENTDGLVLNNRVRAVAIDPRGLWIGYFATSDNPQNGLGHYNKRDWANCNSPEGTASKDVNDIAIDQQGRVWVAAEKTGVAMFDSRRWRTFTRQDGLPSADTFGVVVDAAGNVWVSTWDGVARFDGVEWTTPYTPQNNTLSSGHTHAIAFDSLGNTWAAHIKTGVSQRRSADGKWVHHTKAAGDIGGDLLRSVVVLPEHRQSPESVWFATEDGGVSKFEEGRWTIYTTANGLPSNDINDLAIDRYRRVWAATREGVAYFDGKTWALYNRLNTLNIAFGPHCKDCPFDDDHVWTGTAEHGLTHSRIPLDTEAIEVREVKYPAVVAPGEKFRPEIVVAPRAPYQLREDRGDFLSNTDEDDANLFGTYEHMTVKGLIEPGEAFIFTDHDNPFVAPELPDGVNEMDFTSTWRVWMHTRYVGPPIHITFTVRQIKETG